MLTKHVLAFAAAATFCAGAAYAQDPATPPQHPTINQRIENQGDRIQSGIADGQLTKGEATHLEVRDGEIKAQEHVERKANGGTLTTGEKKQINRELNRNSRQIYRDRRNNRKPKA